MQDEIAREGYDQANLGRPKAGATARRDVVIDAAWEVFAEVGFDAAQIGEVAERAHASKATIYKNFGSKEGLLAAVVNRAIEERAPAIRDALNATSPVDLLRNAGLSLLHALDDQAVALFRLVIGSASRHPDIGQAFQQAIVDEGAIPLGQALAPLLGLAPKEAHLRALMFLGALKEPLFAPKLMGAEPAADPEMVLDIAITMVL